MEKWRAIVNTVMNLWVPLNAENFLTSSETINFSRQTLFRGISLRSGCSTWHENTSYSGGYMSHL